jgi:hypothetical protein
MDSLPATLVAELAMRIVDDLGNVNPEQVDILEVWPKCLSLILGTEGIDLETSSMFKFKRLLLTLTEKTKSFTGASFKTYAINKMCEIEWNQKAVPLYILMFKDIMLEEQELEIITAKIFKY